MNAKRRWVTMILFSTMLILPLNSQTLDSITVNRLYYTAKVWGYLKYFHNRVATGLYNWDSVLIKAIPPVINATSDQDFQSALLTMVQSAGRMNPSGSTPPIVPESLRYNLDIQWTNDPILSQAVRDSLDTIQVKFRPRSNIYVGQASVGNPTFLSDKQFYIENDTTLPNNEIRLLALFRYWNIINYFSPNKYIIDRHWDLILKDFIPLVYHADSYWSYVKVFMMLRTNLNDIHATLNSQYFVQYYYYYLPLKLALIENKTVVTKVLDSSAIHIGDIILKVNGTDITDYRDSLKVFLAGSNPASLNRNIHTFMLRGTKNEKVKFLVETKGGIKDVELVRSLDANQYFTFLAPPKPSWKILPKTLTSKNIGYVNMGLLTTGEIQTLFDSLQTSDAIIFDQRNYPNGTLKTLVGFLFSKSITSANFTVPDIQNPGVLYWRQELIGSTLNPKPYAGKVILLCNEETQSQAEYTIMGLEQHPNAKKIGSQTAGADGDISIIYLPGGLSTYFTGLGCFYPDYRPTQRIGIIPDINASPTIQGIRNGNDEVLDAAYTYLGINGPSSSVNENEINTPRIFSLSQNYPNPFNPSTTIRFEIPFASFVSLKIFDILGREIESLVNEQKDPGSYDIPWNAKDFSSGIYFYQLKTDGFARTKKLILQK